MGAGFGLLIIIELISFWAPKRVRDWMGYYLCRRDIQSGRLPRARKSISWLLTLNPEPFHICIPKR